MLTFDREDGIPVARMPGDVDAANAEGVGSEILAVLDNDAPGMVIDLRGTRYMDSAGLDMLFRIHERLRARRQRVAVAIEDDAPLVRVLRIVALPDVIPMHSDLAGALAAVRGAEEVVESP